MMQKKVVFVQFGIASMSAPHCSFSADTGANAKSYKKAVLHIKAKLDFGLSLILTIYTTVRLLICLLLILKRITAID